MRGSSTHTPLADELRCMAHLTQDTRMLRWPSFCHNSVTTSIRTRHPPQELRVPLDDDFARVALQRRPAAAFRHRRASSRIAPQLQNRRSKLAGVARLDAAATADLGHQLRDVAGGL